MPSSSSYTYKSSGPNSQSSSSSSNPKSYRYTNTSEPLHYSNPRSGTYSNKGNGGTTYTSASGYRTCSGYGKKRVRSSTENLNRAGAFATCLLRLECVQWVPIDVRCIGDEVQVSCNMVDLS
ncbi:hypothetical protein LX36DRAFT_703541 [Colletotrichum falcatum]|nr:hypothetical protein LX36DRAFT_703541 [Colletotrichum falcatum]